MSVDSDIIQIILDVKNQEAEQAKKTLEALANQAKVLDASLASATITQQQYEAGLKKIATDAAKARDSLHSLQDEMRSLSRQGGLAVPKLEGADRAAAKAQLGLAGANILQDAIQGGAGSTINNFLGLAGNGKIRALGAEFLEAAGGVAGLASKLTVAGGAALVLFGTLDTALKKAKLDWSDLDDVGINLAPIKALTETAVGLGEVLKQTGIGEVFDSAWKAGESLVGTVADVTLGWSDATDAARRHKEEVQQQVKAAQDYANAVKSLASVRSDEQDEAAKRGKLVGKEIAELGGAGGYGAVADRLAKLATAKGGDEKVKVQSVNAKGEVEEEEITKREKRRRELIADIGAAALGDTAALDRLKPLLRGAGYNIGGVEVAASGIDRKADEKALDKADAKADAKKSRDDERDAKEQQREFERRSEALARPIQERFDQTSATGGTITREMVRAKLLAGGVSADEADKQADPVLKKLREDYSDRIRKLAGEQGTDAGGAAGLIAADGAKKRKEEADRKEREAEGAARERKEDFDRATAGTALDERARKSVIADVLGGASYAVARNNAIVNAATEAQMGGMGAEDANRAATEWVDKLLGKLGDDRAEANLERKSESVSRHSAADFSNIVESAGAAEQKQTNELLKGTNTKLDELIRKSNVAVMGP